MNLSLSKTAVTSAVFATIVNSATVSATNGSDASDTVSVNVQVATQITYTLTVTNSGDADAVGVTLTDSLPANVFVVENLENGTVGVDSVTWDLGTIAAGSSATVTLTVETLN